MKPPDRFHHRFIMVCSLLLLMVLFPALAFGSSHPDITTESLPDGTVGIAYSATLAGTGGTPPITWGIVSWTPERLPGLSLNSATGEISGTPTATGIFIFEGLAEDAFARTTTKPLSITIHAQEAPTITTNSLPGGTVGAAYSQTLAATGSPAAMAWSVFGNLPAGLSLNPATGEIHGTPTTAGSSTFTITASNGVQPDATQTFTLTVTAKPGGGGAVVLADFVPLAEGSGHEQAVVVNCREWANVRSGPGTEYEIIGRVHPGEWISLLQWNWDETWCNILYDGESRLGWLHYAFIRPVK